MIQGVLCWLWLQLLARQQGHKAAVFSVHKRSIIDYTFILIVVNNYVIKIVT